MFQIVVLSFAVAFASSTHPQCDVTSPLPKQDPPIDWSKFNGTWYETVTSLDAISLEHACITVTDITPDSMGFKALYTHYFDDGRKVPFLVWLLKTEDGHFRQEIVEEEEVDATLQDQSGKIDPRVKSEYDQTEWGKSAWIGDSRHYFAFVKCISSGWVVWAYTRDPMVSSDELVFIHNDLLKHGVSAPLRLGRCKDVNGI